MYKVNYVYGHEVALHKAKGLGGLAPQILMKATDSIVQIQVGTN